MTRRSAVTLMEVLVTMFIMSIGMLSLLVLFPVGAVSMAKALKDDRCASAASMAEQCAIAMNVRQDPGASAFYTTQFAQTVPSEPNVPSFPVYVDPYPKLFGVGPVTTQMGGFVNGSVVTVSGSPPTPIVRTSVSYALSLPLADRWFTLPNDIDFLSAGVPDTTGGVVERGREYSWAYMLQRPQAWDADVVNLTVVVYRKRPTQVPNLEQTYSVNPPGVQDTSGLVLTWNPAMQTPTLKRGVWLLDTTPIAPGSTIPVAKFYRVVNVSDSTSGLAALDVQPNLANNVTQVVIMDYVAEVFNKGTSWKP